MARTIAIIGAGPSGLAAAKSALELGVEPAGFERDSVVGGLWKASGFAWNGLTTNLSRYTCTFSDHPWDKEFGDFPKRDDVRRYLLSYADRFGLDPYIQLNSQITSLVPNRGGWNLTCRDPQSLGESSLHFDSVILASGFFSKAIVPQPRPTVAPFRGTVIHSGAYKAPATLPGRRVLIVGASFSGAEISVELADAGFDVTLVMSRRAWISPRYLPTATGDQTLPLDLLFYTRASNAHTQGLTPRTRNRETNHYFHALGCNPGAIHPALRIDPENAEPPHVVISDRLMELARYGAIRVLSGRVISLHGDAAILADGTAVTTDAVIWCTGYVPDISFFPGQVLARLGFRGSDAVQPLLLYKCTFPLGLDNLAFVGVYRGPYFGIMELQARWACAVFSGVCQMPPTNALTRCIGEELTIREMTPRPQFPHGDYVALADGIAKELDVMPELDLVGELYDWLWNGPLIPAHYRFRGNFSKPDFAREQTREVIERVNVRKP
jgi:dimethylaniline monooxygenase (N-oxide forming)